jgi:predicted RNA methylase
MSATNRKNKRVINDDYPTPSWAIRRFLEKADFLQGDWKDTLWLEPAAGSGNIIKACQSYFGSKHNYWMACDINPNYMISLEKMVDHTMVCDFTSRVNGIYQKPAVVITNPPYNQAMDFINASFDLNARFMVFLLRVNFLAAQARVAFMQKHTPDIYILPNRPSFKATGGTDATEYAWFCWDRFKPEGTPGKVIVLDETPLSEIKLK